MRTPALRRRVDRLLGARRRAAITPERVQAAREAYEERGVLPEEPELRAIVLRIAAFLEVIESGLEFEARACRGELEPCESHPLVRLD